MSAQCPVCRKADTIADAAGGLQGFDRQSRRLGHAGVGPVPRRLRQGGLERGAQCCNAQVQHGGDARWVFEFGEAATQSLQLVELHQHAVAPVGIDQGGHVGAPALQRGLDLCGAQAEQAD